MIKKFAVAVALLMSTNSEAEKSMIEWGNEAALRCAPTDHPLIYQSDFRWGMSLLEVAASFAEIYLSPKRLQKRFHTQNGQIYGEVAQGDEFALIPTHFVYSIKKHIETALERQYAEYVIFPDMGHNHFFVDQAEYDAFDGETFADRMEALIGSPKTKILYHTLEQVAALDENQRLVDDQWLQWRHYTRNIVGDNQGLGQIEIYKNLDSKANTVGTAPEGFRYWGAGVNISANQQGCFSYEHKGQTYYFDASFHDLAYSADNATSDYW
jgi:hypothetical protein